MDDNKKEEVKTNIVENGKDEVKEAVSEVLSTADQVSLLFQEPKKVDEVNKEDNDSNGEVKQEVGSEKDVKKELDVEKIIKKPTRITRMTMSGFKSFAKHTEMLFGEKFNCVLGPNGAGKSTKYDTEILLSSGEIKPIGEIVEESLEKSDRIGKLDDGVFTPDNPLNLQTWGIDPKSMKVVSKNISAFIKREGEPFLYTLVTKSGREVTTTGCHPVMIFKDNVIKSEIVDNLSVGSFISLPNNLDFPEKDIKINLEGANHTGNLTKPIARLLGYLVGDGCIMPKIGRFEFVNADEELLKDYENIVNDLGFKPTVYDTPNPETKRIYCNSQIFIKSLVKLFKNNYKKEKKHIPSQIIFSKKEILSNFLAALFDCDGYVGKDRPTFEYTTMSKKLADNVLLCLLRFGIVARKTVKKKYASNTELKIKRDYYFITIEGQGKLSKLYNQIPLKCQHKRKKLQNIVSMDIIQNPNTDVLPGEVNNIIKDTTKTLCIPYKPLRKDHPLFAAYNENRCNSTRQGVKRILNIFNSKLAIFKEYLSKLSSNQDNLMEAIKTLNLSRVDAAEFIGVSRNTVTDIWDKKIFNARPNNLEKLFDFVKNQISARVEKGLSYIDTLTKLAESHIFWDPIVEIKKIKGDPYVYDLTIPNCHNFIGNGIFVHNSNVLDALCFVLGKSSSRELRAEKSANLIYNGGKNKQAAKKGEVSIYFDNKKNAFPTEDKEIKISRIVKHTGQSIYKINDEVRTRSQIIDLLGLAKINPNGYNIILQGDIVRLVSMRPEERRLLLEDIAGISIYEEKKHKANLELGKVEERLKETEIVLAERNSYLKELKKDRDQALKYKDMNDKIKTNKASFLKFQINKKEKDKKDLLKRNDALKGDFEKIKGKIDGIKQENQGRRDEISAKEKEIEEKGEIEQVKLNKDIESLKIEITKDNSRIETLKNEISKISKREEDLNLNITETGEKIEQLNNDKVKYDNIIKSKNDEKQKLITRLDGLKDRNNMDGVAGIEKKVEEIDKNADEIQKEIQIIREKQYRLIREKDKQLNEIKMIDDRINQVVDVEREFKKQKAELDLKRGDFKKATLELNKSLDQDSANAAHLSSLRNKLSVANEEYAKLKARDIGIKESTRSDIAVTKIVELKNQKKGIHGTVAELGNVDAKYAMALEIAAGPRIKSVVVDSDKVAAECIRYLKEKRFGTATFLPLNKIREKTTQSHVKKIANSKGSYGLALDLMSFDPKFKKAFNYIFADTVVVESIDVAIRLGVGKAKFVTLDGDVSEMSGIMHGGFRTKKRPGLGFKQVELTKEIDEIESTIANFKSDIDIYEKRRAENETAITELRSLKATLEGEIIKGEKSISMETSDVKALDAHKKEYDTQLEKLEEELNEVEENLSDQNSELADLKIGKQKLRNQINQLNNPTVIAEIFTYEKKIKEIDEDKVRVKTQASNIENQIKNIFEPEKVKVEQILKQLKKDESDFKVELKNLNETFSDKEKSLEEKEEKSKKFYSRFKELFAETNSLKESIQKNDFVIDKKNSESRDVEIRLNTLSLKLAEVTAAITGLNTEFQEYEGVRLNTSKSEEELKRDISKFERMKEGIGSVNMRALEIYEDVEKQYKELVEKKDTLSSEREGVIGMMNEIEGKKKELFMETYDAINENFKKFFSMLSTKGANANLVLEDEENPLEGGVRINVKITGSKYLDIRSLSGGEKTMTALAFIFSIQEHEPASFYVLDEIDAALDKSNSLRLAKLIKDYSMKAQYLLISHNDSVINEADILYGVSMNKDGVSQVLSLKV